MATPKVFDIAPASPPKSTAQTPIVQQRSTLAPAPVAPPAPTSSVGEAVTVRRETVIKPPVELNDVSAPEPVKKSDEFPYKVPAQDPEVEQPDTEEAPPQTEVAPEDTEPVIQEEAKAGEDDEPLEKSASGVTLAPIETRSSIIEDHKAAAEEMQSPKVYDTKQYILPISHHRKDDPKKSIRNFLIVFTIIVLLVAAVYVVDAEIVDIGIKLPFDLVK